MINLTKTTAGELKPGDLFVIGGMKEHIEYNVRNFDFVEVKLRTTERLECYRPGYPVWLITIDRGD